MIKEMDGYNKWDGNTIRDPQPVDENFNLIKKYKKSKDFPFQRKWKIKNF